MKSLIKLVSRLLSLTLLVGCVSTFNLSASAEFDINSNHLDVYRNNKNQYNKIALTFDDGPHPRQTREILDILDKYNVKATFFSVGVNAHYYRDTLEEVIKRGHEVGNHTYTHPHVSHIDMPALKREIDKCEAEIYEIGEYKTKLFRPPEGMIDNGIASLLRELDYKVILWDIDTRDWDHTPPGVIADMVIHKISSGDIILMHDYISYNSPTPEALNIFLPVLLEMGYQFVTVSELIGLN